MVLSLECPKIVIPSGAESRNPLFVCGRMFVCYVIKMKSVVCQNRIFSCICGSAVFFIIVFFVLAFNVAFGQAVNQPTSVITPSCPNQATSTLTLPIKICRAVAANDPEQCFVWYGPKTHLKMSFSSHILDDDTPLTTSPTGRVTKQKYSFLAGSNTVDALSIGDIEQDGERDVALFVNTLYNDVEAEMAKGSVRGTIATLFGLYADKNSLVNVSREPVVDAADVFEEWPLVSRAYNSI